MCLCGCKTGQSSTTDTAQKAQNSPPHQETCGHCSTKASVQRGVAAVRVEKQTIAAAFESQHMTHCW